MGRLLQRSQEMNGRRQSQRHLVAPINRAQAGSSAPRSACDWARGEGLEDLLATDGYAQAVSRLDHTRPPHPQGHYMGLAPHRDGLGSDYVVGARASEMARILIAYAKTKKKCLFGWLVCAIAILPGLMGWI